MAVVKVAVWIRLPQSGLVSDGLSLPDAGQLGAALGESLEVLDGVKPGELVVTTGSFFLAGGSGPHALWWMSCLGPERREASGFAPTPPRRSHPVEPARLDGID